MCPSVIELLVVRECSMGISARDDAQLERVDTQVLLVSDAVDQRLAHVAVVDPAQYRGVGTDQVLVLLFKTGKFIVGRQGRMRIRLPFDLDDFRRHFVERTSLRNVQ